MNEKELIEKLKVNLALFALLSAEEQCYLVMTGTDKALLLCNDGTWTAPSLSEFVYNCVYRLKPDYQPEKPKEKYRYEDIVDGGGFLRTSENEIPIDCLPRETDFDGFYRIDEETNLPVDVILESVARHIRMGRKVKARFVNE